MSPCLHLSVCLCLSCIISDLPVCQSQFYVFFLHSCLFLSISFCVVRLSVLLFNFSYPPLPSSSPASPFPFSLFFSFQFLLALLSHSPSAICTVPSLSLFLLSLDSLVSLYLPFPFSLSLALATTTCCNSPLLDNAERILTFHQRRWNLLSIMCRERQYLPGHFLIAGNWPRYVFNCPC